MPWHVDESISYCELDDRLFFLDLQRDRYFQLSETLEHRFRAYVEVPENSANLDQLLAQGLRLHASPINAAVAAAETSVPELPDLEARVDVVSIFDTMAVVWMTRRSLRTQPIAYVLEEMDDYRRRKVAARSAAVRGQKAKQDLISAANAFNHVRPYIPIARSCVIDSVSLIRFLAKRGLSAQLVMGVACDPFSAHAWVQSGSLVLNDSVGSVQGHVPIRVI